ncbi:Glutamate racemase [Sterolibacterium denitrificans]|uniref:Glutamate racemase n=1 Tax=Sterolibacterium denitrificans TaxID=157592 RepID=A0A7Z7HRY4_9PROT|nr:glutamate racemase [Sterolibacterium denitrificans]SMB26780.1 Glutamate racemase [Sterolibacterium denitrificans]
MIGAFDSGLGGLSVLAAIARVLPRADLVYLADTAHVPYGDKTDDFIRGRVLAIGRHLVAAGCTTLVAACNTATAAAVQALRDDQPGIAVVGIEPGVKPAAVTSRSRRIAVLATESTASSARLKHLIDTHATGAGVFVQVEPCPGWATRVEMLQLDGPEFAAEVAARIAPLLDAGADRLVLGCTHYAFLADLLRPLVAGRAELVEVADAVAREVVRRAGTAAHGSGRIRLHATARPERLHAALPALGLGMLMPRIDGPALLIRHL